MISKDGSVGIGEAGKKVSPSLPLPVWSAALEMARYTVGYRKVKGPVLVGTSVCSTLS
jgi:hypothetical protein